MNLQIPYTRHSLGEAEIQAVAAVMRSGWLTGGPKVAEFEAACADYLGARHCMAVSSGAMALSLALLAHGIGPGDTISTTPVTYAGAVNAILLVGARPVFEDIDLRTGMATLSGAGGSGIMPMSYGGQPIEIASSQGRCVILDAAHAMGASIEGKKIGSQGTVCFSFHPAKNMTTGEGGLIATDNDRVAEQLNIMRLHGITRPEMTFEGKTSVNPIRQTMTSWGFKANMTDIQAAIGLVQLEKLDAMNERRAEWAGRYLQWIYDHEMPFEPVIQPAEDEQPSWHLFPVLVPDHWSVSQRNRRILWFHKRGIQVQVHYYHPVHLHPWYREKYGYKEGDFPNAERFCERVMSLPLYPDMTEEEFVYVTTTIEGIVKKWPV